MSFLPWANFRFRLLLGAVLPALVMVAMLESAFLDRYGRDMTRTFRERGEAVARQLGPAAEYAIFTGSDEALRVLIDATRSSDPQIVGVSVLGRDGRVLAHSGTTPTPDLAPEHELRVLEGADATTVIAPIRQTTLPLDGGEGWEGPGAKTVVLAGYVVVELSRKELASRQREMLLITLAILLVGLPLAAWISSRNAADVLNRLNAAGAELSRQKEAAEALARTDALTGLANRRAFDEATQREIQRALRYGSPLTLVISDIDHFKAINDAHGHHVGDLVLRDFAAVLARSVRGVDLVGRWGGEEFVILMPGTTLDEAEQAAERMRLEVAGTPTRAEGRGIGYTASFGVAVFDPVASTIDDLLGRADAALYRAKAGGRNRVEVARPPVPAGVRFPATAMTG